MVWSVINSGGHQGLTAILVVVLAAILGPEAYGLLAMASAYVFFLQMFLEQGMAAALIQRRDLRPEHLDAGFWILVATSVVLTGIGIALRDWWAGVNDLPELGLVILVLSGVVPLIGLSVVPLAILQRRMDFRRLAIRNAVAVGCGGAIGIWLAFEGAGVWALVAQQLTTALVGLVTVAILVGWVPRLRFSRSAAGELLSFSSGALLGRVGQYVTNRADALLMGIFFGPVAVGLYRLADRLMSLIVDLSSQAVQSVALPELSRVQDDEQLLARGVERCLAISAGLAFPALAVLATARTEVVALLGERWQAAGPLLPWLCFAGGVRAVTLLTGSLMQAVGRPHALALLIWAHAVPSALLVWGVATLLQDLESGTQAAGIAASRAFLFGLVFLPVHWFVVGRILPRARRAAVIAPALAASLVGAAGVVAVQTVAPAGVPETARSLVTLAVGAGVAMLALLALDANARTALAQRFGSRRPPTDADRAGAKGSATLGSRPRGDVHD